MKVRVGLVIADLQRTVYPYKWLPISWSGAGQGKFAGQKPTFYHCSSSSSSVDLYVQSIVQNKFRNTVKIKKNISKIY